MRRSRLRPKLPGFLGQNLEEFQAAPKPLQFTAAAEVPSFAEVRAAIAKQVSALAGRAWGVETIIRIEWENRMQNKKAKALRQPRVFEVWKEYEAIATHVLSAALVILALVWTAIWILDVKHYSRLLDGAVYAVL